MMPWFVLPTCVTGIVTEATDGSFLSQVQNYNFALSRISPDSKYCKMVQADDWLFPDCVRSMVEVAEAVDKSW
jgi:hypothetical protein